MSNSGPGHTDLATLSTRDNAFETLQSQVGEALGRAKRRNPSGPLQVGIIGPGELTVRIPDGEKTYSPQVEETLQTMRRAKVKGELHVYDYLPPDAPAKHDRKVTSAKFGYDIDVKHHRFDLMAPDASDASRNDVLIGTRVLGDVLARKGEEPRKANESRGKPIWRGYGPEELGERQRIVEAFLDKGKPDADVIMDKPVGRNVTQWHHDVLSKRGMQLTTHSDGQLAVFGKIPDRAVPKRTAPAAIQTSSATQPSARSKAVSAHRTLETSLPASARRAATPAPGTRSGFNALSGHERSGAAMTPRPGTSTATQQSTAPPALSGNAFPPPKFPVRHTARTLKQARDAQNKNGL